VSADSTGPGEARDSTDARAAEAVVDVFLEVAVEARADRAPVLPGIFAEI
jgi:hypothetical protein